VPTNGSPIKKINGMYNNAKDVKTEIDNTLRVSAPLRPCVKLENNNAKMQRRNGAKNKSLRVYFTGIFGCALSSSTYSILCEYPHIKPRDYTRLTQKSCGNPCNRVVPTTSYPRTYVQCTIFDISSSRISSAPRRFNSGIRMFTLPFSTTVSIA